jgi:nicotinamidase-related amidase
LQDHKGGLRFGPLEKTTVHVCVDMQRLFAESTPWQTPWMARVAPRIVELAAAHPANTIFTRFVPAARPGHGRGVWRRYWDHWASVTIEHLGADMVELIPELARLVPPAEVIDKHVYSPWLDEDLQESLKARQATTLVVSGGETDVCVLATVLGAVDRGYRTIVLTDALCSSSDETHDAMMTLYARRYGQQIETVMTEEALDAWGR